MGRGTGDRTGAGVAARARRRRGHPARWLVAAALLVAIAAGAAVAAFVAPGSAWRTEVTAVLPSAVRPTDAPGVLRTGTLIDSIAAAAGRSTAEIRGGLSRPSVRGWHVTLAYRADAPAPEVRHVAVDALRRLAATTLDLAITRDDRALVAAGRAEPAAAAVAGDESRAAEGARRARDAALDVTVATTRVRPGWWPAALAVAAASGALAGITLVGAARARRRRVHRSSSAASAASATPGGEVAPSVPTDAPLGERLDLDELERRFAELDRRARAAGTAA